ncbi:MAG: hypothetical protein ABI867_14255 [Kofleriaceae bacterium]
MEFTPEQLERMRQIGLRLDRAGTFWHDGTSVTHPRLRQALLRWLDVRDGRDIVKLDDHRFAYVEIEDAHLRALSAHWEGDRCLVLWDDDHEEELDYTSLRQTPDHAFYATARGVLRGRIAGPAHHAIAERVVEHDDGFALAATGSTWPIINAT